MAIPAHAVPSHLLYALTVLGAVLLVSWPGAAVLMLVLLMAMGGLAVRSVSAWTHGEDAPSRFIPLIAIGVLLVPSFLALVSVPLSLRGPEGAGPIFGGLGWLGAWVPYAFALALVTLPVFMVASVWALHDRARRIALFAGAASWLAAAGAAFVLLVVVPTPVAQEVRRALMVALRVSLGVLAFGFLYGLKSDPHMGSTRAADDPALH